MIIETILVFIVIIIALVVSHELGHFLVAKFFNVRVEEFGIGIPPRLWGWRHGETIYSVNLLPIGGFVRIADEEGPGSDPRGFAAQGFLKKVAIVAAGVLANLLVAVMLFAVLAWFGVPIHGVKIEGVALNSPAESSGIAIGDVITNIGGSQDESISIAGVQKYVSDNLGKNIEIGIKRGNDFISVSVVPREHPPEGEGALGIIMNSAPARIGFKTVSWYRAPLEGIKMTASFIGLIARGLADFLSKLFISGEEVGKVGEGPVLIAVFARDALDIGLREFIQLLAIISINLALINILPIPALDGGRILFFIIEKIKGSPIPPRLSASLHSAFFVILIILLIWITYSDITFLSGLSP